MVLNGANEVAVQAFLDGGISFGQIPKIIVDALESVSQRRIHSIEDVYQADAEARRRAEKTIRRQAC